MVSDIEIRLRADIARLQQDMDKARQAVGGSLDKINTAVGKTVGAFGGLAVAAGGAMFVTFIKGSIDAADALNDLSNRTKVAATDLVGLNLAAKLSGTELENVAGAVNKLSMNIGKDTQKFRELGISATDPIEAFKQLADVFKAIEDPQQRAAFGAATLGKSWAEVAPLLNEGAVSIGNMIDRGEKLSGVTEEIVKDAAKFNDTLDEMKIAAQGTGTRIAADLLPLMQLLAENIKTAKQETDGATEGFKPLTETFRALVIFGGEVAFTFKAVGTEIGVISAKIVGYSEAVAKFFSLDFKGGMARVIDTFVLGDIAKADAEKARAAHDVWVDSWSKVGTAAAKTEEQVGGSAEEMLAALDAASKNAERVKKATEFLKSEEIAAARTKAAAEAAAAAKKEETAYISLIVALKEKQAANQLELTGGMALNEAQKARIKLDQELASGKLKLTPAHIKEARALLDTLDAQEQSLLASKHMKDALEELDQERKASIKTAVAEADSQEKLVAEFGLTKSAIEALALARAEERLSQRASLELDEKEVEMLEKIIAAKKRAVDSAETLEAMGAQKKAIDENTKAQLDMWDSIDKTAHDTFISIANGGKNAAQRLKETFKNVFFDWLYQQTVKKWLINIGMVGSGSWAGAAQAFGGGEAGGAGGGAMSMLSAGKSIYDVAAGGFSGVSTGVTAGIDSASASLGYSSGAYGPTASGGNIASSGFSQGAGTAAGYAAGIAAGVYGGRAISGGYSAIGGGSGNTAVNVGTAIGAIWGPIGAAIGGMIGGLVNRAFGKKQREATGQGLTGTFGEEGFTGQSFQNWIEKGGWFRSDTTGTNTAAVDPVAAKALGDAFEALKQQTMDFAEVLGIPADQIKGFTQSISVALTGDTARDQQILVDLLNGIGDSLATTLIPNLQKFAVEGEKASATMARLAGDYVSIDVVLKALGRSFGAVGADSLEARERLLAMAGGINGLIAKSQSFADNFLTQAEKMAPVQKQVTEQLAAMGLAAVTTKDQFKAVVMGLDLTTEAGARQFSALLDLSSAFAAVATAAEESAAKAAEAAAEIAKAQREALEAADAAAAQARNQLISELGAAAEGAFAAVQDSIEAEKAAKKAAFDDLISGIEAGMARVNGKIADLKNLASALGAVSFSKNEGQQAASTTVARSQIAAAVAIARASGVLPSADSLKFALSNVGADTSGQFATTEDYQRSQIHAANDVAALAKLTEGQLTVEEKTLQILMDQKTAAQVAYQAEYNALMQILENAKLQLEMTRRQIDAANRGNNILAYIPPALRDIPYALDVLSKALATWKSVAAPQTGVAAGGDYSSQIELLYGTLLRRGSDAAGLEFWTSAMKAGVTMEHIRDEFMRSPEYLALQTAQATQNVGYSPTAQAGTMAQDNSAALLRELKILNEQMDTMKAEIAKTANNTGQSAQANSQLSQQFDQVSGGGTSLFTELVPGTTVRTI